MNGSQRKRQWRDYRRRMKARKKAKQKEKNNVTR